MAQNLVTELEIPPHRNAALMTSMNIRLEFLPAKVANDKSFLFASFPQLARAVLSRGALKALD